MLSRRDLVIGGTALATLGSAARADPAGDFAALLAATQRNPAENEAARADTEGRAFEATRGPAPRSTHSDRPISDDAVSLIIASEVTGQAYYDQRLEVPALPPGDSGMTIGVGYDLGWSRPAWVDSEWTELSPAVRTRLKAVCGKHGAAARPLKTGLRDIRILWDDALAQFKRVLLPLYVGATVQALPNTDLLSQDCLGALVDLVYNRGAGGFVSARPQYREMAAIRRMMNDQQFDTIADQIEAMTRLWLPNAKNQPGNVRRRRAEAALFRKGLPTA